MSIKRVEGQVLPVRPIVPPAEGDTGDLDDMPELGLSEDVFAPSDEQAGEAESQAGVAPESDGAPEAVATDAPDAVETEAVAPDAAATEAVAPDAAAIEAVAPDAVETDDDHGAAEAQPAGESQDAETSPDSSA